MSDSSKDLHEVASLRTHIQGLANEKLGLIPWTTPMLEPVPEWLVPGFLQSRALHVLSSDSGCCKTWLGLTLMLSGLFGIPVLGSAPARRFSSIYLAADSTSWDVGQQLRKLMTAHRLHPKQQADDVHGFVMPIGFLFDNEQHVNLIAEMARHWDIDALFIDVMLYAHMADENDNGEMSRSVLRAAKWLRDKTDLAIFLIHHNSKDGGYRGAGTITQAVEHHLTLQKSADNIITMRVQKIRADEALASNLRFMLDRPDHGGRKLSVISPQATESPKPSIQAIVLGLLSMPGMETGLARSTISDQLPDLSPRSVDNALTALKTKGLVTNIDGKWRASSPRSANSLAGDASPTTTVIAPSSGDASAP